MWCHLGFQQVCFLNPCSDSSHALLVNALYLIQSLLDTCTNLLNLHCQLLQRCTLSANTDVHNKPREVQACEITTMSTGWGKSVHAACYHRNNILRMEGEAATVLNSTGLNCTFYTYTNRNSQKMLFTAAVIDWFGDKKTVSWSLFFSIK